MPTWTLTRALLGLLHRRLLRVARQCWRWRRAVASGCRAMRRSSGQAIVHWGAAYATTAIASGIIGMNGIVCGEAGDAPFPFLRLLALTSLTLAAALLCCVAALLAYASERGRY